MDALVKQLVPDRPRLGFRPTAERGARTIESARRAYAETPAFRQLYQRILDRPDTRCDVATLAGKWIVTGRDAAAELAVQGLANAKIRPTGPNDYSAIWRYALAYDWLDNHPAMTDRVRDAIEGEIGRVLELELRDLDSGGPAMWHGRNQYANNAIVAALSLSRHPRREEFLRRALAHYWMAVRALALVEAWPEGPSYWICNRAVQYPLAADCVRTALGVDEIAGVNILEAIRATGYWQLYQMMPNRQFVPYGDAFGGAALATWQPWAECIDYYATYTRDPNLIAYAEYARQVSVATAYGRFGWALGLIYDPFLPMPADYDRTKPLDFIARHVPTARLFGRNTTGIAFFRSSWTDPAATFVSFKAGDLFAHHGHYDQGQFTIFKHATLAPITGAYHGYTSLHRLGYYVQTVGVNSLLVLAPGEYSNYLRSHQFPIDALSGGQRVVMAAGSNVPSVDHWLADRTAGQHFEAADIIAYQSVPGDYDYIAADLTAAYNSTRFAERGNVAKVSHVARYLVYLHPRPGTPSPTRREGTSDLPSPPRGEGEGEGRGTYGTLQPPPSPDPYPPGSPWKGEGDVIVIFDRVVSTNAAFRKRWLLHHKTKPVGGEERVILGAADNGVVEATGRRFVTTVGEGQLIHDLLLPAEARAYKVGGPDYAFYAETDGDGAQWTGRNLAIDGRGPTADLGLWRTEVEPAAPAKEDVFLNVLWPRAAATSEPPAAQVLTSDGATVAVHVGDDVLVFARQAEGVVSRLAFGVPKGAKRILLFGMTPRRPYLLYPVSGSAVDSGPEGVLAWQVPFGFSGDAVVNVARE